MKSRITIEVDFDNRNEPVIQILARDSDDVRDNLIQQFLNRVVGSWCKVSYVHGEKGVDFPDPDGVQRVYISPIHLDDLKMEGSAMIELYKFKKSSQNIASNNTKKEKGVKD
jgi:hypothetical protein